MVAPDESGVLSRSLVRVPGSGSDRSATPVSCDLGRVSSLAAMVPINPNLPDIITRHGAPASIPRTLTEAEVTVDKLGSQLSGPVRRVRVRTTSSQPYQVPRRTGDQTTPSGTTAPFPLIPPPPQAELPPNFSADRRARIRYLTPEEAMRRAPNILHVNTQHGPVLFMPVQSEGSKLHRAQVISNPNVQARPVVQRVIQEATPHQGPGLRIMTLEQLMKEQSDLRQENQDLNQQVSRFRQLFQNPERLVSVLRQLGIKVESN